MSIMPSTKVSKGSAPVGLAKGTGADNEPVGFAPIKVAGDVEVTGKGPGSGGLAPAEKGTGNS